MAKSKQQQIPLVSAAGEETQPPFPGGWVLSLFSTLDHFLGSNAALPLKPRTRTRVLQGADIQPKSAEELITRLASIFRAYFPAVSDINGFATHYAKEYVGCWTVSLQCAPHFTKAFGYEPETSSVFARCLVRDLFLRLAYLESFERLLQKDHSLLRSNPLLSHQGTSFLYGAMIREARATHDCSETKMARRLNATDRQFRRFREGKAAPAWSLLEELSANTRDLRLVAGIGLIDTLLHRFGLADGSLGAELLAAAEKLFPAHGHALAKLDEQGRLHGFIRAGTQLLCHPGFDAVWGQMPSALWRAHVYTLQFARMTDMAHAYAQYGNEQGDRDLEDFFVTAEKRSNSCPYGWMNELRRPNPTSLSGSPKRRECS